MKVTDEMAEKARVALDGGFPNRVPGGSYQFITDLLADRETWRHHDCSQTSFNGKTAWEWGRAWETAVAENARLRRVVERAKEYLRLQAKASGVAVYPETWDAVKKDLLLAEESLSQALDSLKDTP